MREQILAAVVIRFQICIFDILNTAPLKFDSREEAL